VVAGAGREMEQAVERGGVEMDEERPSTAGDALLMGGARWCCDPTAAAWPVRRVAAGFGWLSEARSDLAWAGGQARVAEAR
jgi:hypothetical protein